jgi:hypothetical protein
MASTPTSSVADAIWNRAAAHRGEGEGDLHLRALLLVHGAVMNGGPEHAASTLESADFEATGAACRYFDLIELASVVTQIPAAEDSDDEDERLNNAYFELVPADEVLYAAFAARYTESPGDFDSIDS